MFRCLKKQFSDRGLCFIPVRKYEYMGKIFEEWRIIVASSGHSLGHFTWPIGSYPTRKELSAHFEAYRKIININD